MPRLWRGLLGGRLRRGGRIGMRFRNQSRRPVSARWASSCWASWSLSVDRGVGRPLSEAWLTTFGGLNSKARLAVIPCAVAPSSVLSTRLVSILSRIKFASSSIWSQMAPILVFICSQFCPAIFFVYARSCTAAQITQPPANAFLLDWARLYDGGRIPFPPRRVGRRLYSAAPQRARASSRTSGCSRGYIRGSTPRCASSDIAIPGSGSVRRRNKG